MIVMAGILRWCGSDALWVASMRGALVSVSVGMLCTPRPFHHCHYIYLVSRVASVCGALEWGDCDGWNLQVVWQ